MKKKIMVGITGASGIAVGIKLIEYLADKKEVDLSVCISENGKKVCNQELNMEWKEITDGMNVNSYENNDYNCSYASGSSKNDGMIRCPCSMGTLARIANGISGNLIERAADVCIKEKRKLVLVVREMPLHSIHLKNMLILSKLNVVIIPMIMSFYTKDSYKSIDKHISFLVGRILEQYGIENDLVERWGT